MKRIVTAIALTALAAHSTFAADLTLGARTEVWYDDNVLGTDQDKVSDAEVLLSPTIGLSERWGTVDAVLNFEPNYEFFLDEKDLRGLNYGADGSLAWKPTARTSFELSDTFLRYRSLRLLTTPAQSGGTPAEFGARDKFFRNITQLIGSHRLTPIDVVQLSGSFSLWEFDEERRFDQKTFGAALNYQHSISRTVALGAGASYSRLRIEQRGGIPQRDTDYVNLSLIANYEPADTFFVRFSAGPTWVRQPRVSTPSLVRLDLYRFSGNDILVGLVPSTCPTLPSGEFFDGPGCNLRGVDPVVDQLLFQILANRALDPVFFQGGVRDRDDITYFADVSVERKWEAASLSLAYRRDEGSNSAAGFSTVADLVELRGVIRPLRELTFTAAVSWENREETQTGAQFVTILDTVPGSPTQPAINNLVPVGVRGVSGSGPSESVESISAFLNASYQITARAQLTSAFTWRDQNSTDTSLFSDYERFQVMFGINVELEPIRW